MLKTIMLGLVLAAIALSGTVSVAISVTSAETAPSPLQQVRGGVPTSEVMCSENRVLMVSQTGIPACVFEESVPELETRGFEFIGEPFDMFPIKSTGDHVSDSRTGPPPVISMSRLPNINETAVVEITYTNNFYNFNVTDTEDFSIHDSYKLGWVVSPGFEIVDSGGVEPWLMYVSQHDPQALTYWEFVPLDFGESKTYRIVVKAVSEGYNYVAGIGYLYETATIDLYLDDEETLPYLEHLERYPEMHERQARAESQPPPSPTKAERDALMAATPPYVAPTRETVMEWFADFFEGEDPNPEVGWSLDLIFDIGASINVNMTDARQILSDAGYSDGEIDDAVSGAVSVASAETVPSPLQQVRDGVPIGEVVCSNDRVLMVSQTGMPACVFEESILELDKRGFEFIGEPFDMFPIKSTGDHVSDSRTGPPPVISMSRLPNINETAVVEITYTNNFYNFNVTDTEDFSVHDSYKLGWVVSPGFEIVDSGGVEPWLMYVSERHPQALTYREFVPLDFGESKTYRIVIKAVSEGTNYVAGVGYLHESARIQLYLDDEETLPFLEHLKRYPEMYERPVRAESQPPSPPTKAEKQDLEEHLAAQDEPTREETVEWFINYLIDSGNSADWAVTSMWHSGILNSTEIRTVLAGANFTDNEIDEAMTDNMAAQSAAP